MERQIFEEGKTYTYDEIRDIITSAGAAASVKYNELLSSKGGLSEDKQALESIAFIMQTGIVINYMFHRDVEKEKENE